MPKQHNLSRLAATRSTAIRVGLRRCLWRRPEFAQSCRLGSSSGQGVLPRQAKCISNTQVAVLVVTTHCVIQNDSTEQAADVLQRKRINPAQASIRAFRQPKWKENPMCAEG